jgi:hypothetical protein
MSSSGTATVPPNARRLAHSVATSNAHHARAPASARSRLRTSASAPCTPAATIAGAAPTAATRRPKRRRSWRSNVAGSQAMPSARPITTTPAIAGTTVSAAGPRPAARRIRPSRTMSPKNTAYSTTRSTACRSAASRVESRSRRSAAIVTAMPPAPPTVTTRVAATPASVICQALRHDSGAAIRRSSQAYPLNEAISSTTAPRSHAGLPSWNSAHVFSRPPRRGTTRYRTTRATSAIRAPRGGVRNTRDARRRIYPVASVWESIRYSTPALPTPACRLTSLAWACTHATSRSRPPRPWLGAGGQSST